MEAKELALGSSPERPANTFTSRVVAEALKSLGRGDVTVQFSSIMAQQKHNGNPSWRARYVCADS